MDVSSNLIANNFNGYDFFRTGLIGSGTYILRYYRKNVKAMFMRSLYPPVCYIS